MIFIPFAGGRPERSRRGCAHGFVTTTEQALGRPVGVTVDNRGALLVADDVGNTIWRVTPAQTSLSSRE